MYYVVFRTGGSNGCCACDELTGYDEVEISSVSEHFGKVSQWEGELTSTLRRMEKNNLKFGQCYEMCIGLADTVEEAWSAAFEGFVNQVTTAEWEENGSQLRFFWFVDYGSGTYQAQGLRAVVQEFPGVLSLGEHVNANTGNTVDGYMIKLECSKGENYYDDDED